jgi:hypothetical protein
VSENDDKRSVSCSLEQPETKEVEGKGDAIAISRGTTGRAYILSRLDRDGTIPRDASASPSPQAVARRPEHDRPTERHETQAKVLRDPAADEQSGEANSHGRAADSREVARHLWKQRDASSYPLAKLL